MKYIGKICHTYTAMGGMQLGHDLLINFHSNNYHIIRSCCHGNADEGYFGFLKFCLINIGRFCWKQLENTILYAKTIK